MAQEGFLSLTNPETWVFFAAVGFAALIWKKGRFVPLPPLTEGGSLTLPEEDFGKILLKHSAGVGARIENEVRAREGIVIAVVNEGDKEAGSIADHVIEIPHTSELLLPILEIVPLQLLAYHIAVGRNCGNLAKSVTAE